MSAGRAPCAAGDAFGGVIAAPAVWVVMRSPATKWMAWLIAVPATPLTVVAVLMPGGHGATLSRNLNARQRAASFGT